MTQKDFGSIADDYAFFMAQSTEAASDLAVYQRELLGFAADRTTIDFLDFGCGTGAFTHRFVTAMGWPSAGLRIALVEPVWPQREEAARRLASLSPHPIECLDQLPSAGQRTFDIILANHVLYYVDAIDTILRDLIGCLAVRGQLMLAIAGWDNALMRLWQIGFALLGQPVPFHAADDVQAALARHSGIRIRSRRADYRLRFADTTDNRLKILRFLFGPYLTDTITEPLLKEFDAVTQNGFVDMTTHSEHFSVQRD